MVRALDDLPGSLDTGLPTDLPADLVSAAEVPNDAEPLVPRGAET
jgi:hypothetical protein